MSVTRGRPGQSCRTSCRTGPRQRVMVCQAAVAAGAGLGRSATGQEGAMRVRTKTVIVGPVHSGLIPVTTIGIRKAVIELPAGASAPNNDPPPNIDSPDRHYGAT
jgi:hypothetical protein